MTGMAQYQPGTCNIGRAEIRKRYGLAAAAFALAAIASYVILLLGWPGPALLSPFALLLTGFEGFYQGYLKFCAGFAARGK